MAAVKRIFLGLAIWNSIFLLAVCGLGWWASYDPASRHFWHMWPGVVVCLFTCLTQCIVIIHFSGSGKGVKEAVEGNAIADDPETGYARRVRRFRGKMSAWAYPAVLLIVTATLLGGAYDGARLFHDPASKQQTLHYFHLGVSLFAVAFNLYSFVAEYRLICENTAMIAELNRLIEQRAGSAAGSRAV